MHRQSKSKYFQTQSKKSTINQIMLFKNTPNFPKGILLLLQLPFNRKKNNLNLRLKKMTK